MATFNAFFLLFSVFVLALPGEVLIWIFSFLKSINQIYSGADGRRGKTGVLEMEAWPTTPNSAWTTVRLAWLPMLPPSELWPEIQSSYHRTQQTLAGGQCSPLFLCGFVTYFCMALEIRMVFTFLNGWKKTKRRTIFWDMWKLHEIHFSVSVSKVLLGYSHSHLFTYCPWLRSHCNRRVEWIQRCDRGWMALKA